MPEVDFVDESPPRKGLYSLKSRLTEMRGIFTRAGNSEAAVRLATHLLLVGMVLIGVWVMRMIYLGAQSSDLQSEELQHNNFQVGNLQPKNLQPKGFQPEGFQPEGLQPEGLQQEENAVAASQPTPRLTSPPVQLPSEIPNDLSGFGIPRLASLHTNVPSRPRMEVTVYTVQSGDTLFGIADKFGLNPETILWSNQYILGDNPHNLQPGQEINILPVDGAYHKWSAGDGLNGVAKFFNVEPQAIIEFPGNRINPEAVGDWANPNIEAGTWLVIPGGQRQFVSWSAPEIPLDNPGVANVLGTGACGTVSPGAVGSGNFIWPANNRFLSGFDYNPRANHMGIDIDGEDGDPVYASDNGVVVYAGWNDWGYGNVVVINHDNGWQTLYAHLSDIYVNCGQSVWQTNVIGAIGSTGKSSGSHLHFEMMYNGGKVNPHDYLN